MSLLYIPYLFYGLPYSNLHQAEIYCSKTHLTNFNYWLNQACKKFWKAQSFPPLLTGDAIIYGTTKIMGWIIPGI